jgi:hypothetical protein
MSTVAAVGPRGRRAPRHAGTFGRLAGVVWVTLLGGGLLHGPCAAQSPSLGALRYATPIDTGTKACAESTCHGTRFEFDTNLIRSAATAENIQTALGRVEEMRFLDGRLTALDLNDLAAYVARETGQAPFFLPAPEAAPTLTPASPAVDFGAVLVGTTRTLTLSIGNTGRAPLRLASATSDDAAFALSHDCTPDVPIDGRCTLTIQFTPALQGAAQAQAQLASNDPDSPARLTLSASGTNSAVAVLQWAGNPAALTLPTTALGQVSTPVSLTLRNVGTVAATLDELAVIGGNAAAFPLLAACGAGDSLDPGSNCEVSVQFAPIEVGAPAAQLRVQAQGAGLPPVVLLSGTATAAGTSTGGSAVDTNYGGGGCTVGRADDLFDPLWALMLGSAVAVTWRRRAERRRQARRGAQAEANAVATAGEREREGVGARTAERTPQDTAAGQGPPS